jgi:hypothetical protein
MKECFVFLLVFLFVAVFCSPRAEAVTNARYHERVAGTMNESPDIPGSIVINVSNFYGKAETSGTGAALPGASGPYAEAVLDITGDAGGLSGIASASVSYYFGVEGAALPDGVDAVPLIIDAMLLMEVDLVGTPVINLGEAFAEIIVTPHNQPYQQMTLHGYRNISTFPDPPVFVWEDRTWNPTLNLGMGVGVEGNIYLQALLIARVGEQGNSVRLRAVADPIIRIDPDFALAYPGYSVVTSPGVIAPEPCIICFLGLGTGVLIRVRRRTG